MSEITDEERQMFMALSAKFGVSGAAAQEPRERWEDGYANPEAFNQQQDPVVALGQVAIS